MPPLRPAALAADYLRGLLMGTADSIPGVSGGTVALIVGIYERLIASIGSGFRALLSALRLRPRRAVAHLRQVEWRLVLPLLAGILTALLAAAEIIPALLERYPAESRAIFLGMVAASLAIPFRRIDTRTLGQLWVGALAAVVAFVLTGIPPATVTDPTFLQVFGAAAIAISAMILPGISGAFLLLVLGMYQPTLAAVERRDLVYVGVFGAGVVVGLGSVSLVLSVLLRRFHDLTMAALIGLMLGSLRALWPWQGPDRELMGPGGLMPALTAAALAAAGLLLVTAVDRISNRSLRPLARPGIGGPRH